MSFRGRYIAEENAIQLSEPLPGVAHGEIVTISITVPDEPAAGSSSMTAPDDDPASRD